MGTFVFAMGKADSEAITGFQSPAQDYTEGVIDLNKELVSSPNSTFYARVKGNSFEALGVGEGDIIVVDKSLIPKQGDLAVCVTDGEFVLKHIKAKEKQMHLWGVVTYSIKKLRK